ncbi:hypothetical protein AB0I06_03975 [Streptomyces sp. NPDC050674]|uniref:hypothetical protein n=1 Tax=Streptomyces sp. NPDC050674 TaxID=3157216 RepID=UPI003417405F
MNDLGELDRPGTGTPTGPGARDAHSERDAHPERKEERGRERDPATMDSPGPGTDAGRAEPGEGTPPGEQGAATGAATGGKTPVQCESATDREVPFERRESATDPDAASVRREPAAGRKASTPRRGAADPVKALMHRHRELCERAVDPLEIAAGLEAHGITDRTAARFRHRDVFSLAEEMYARVSPDGDTPPPAPPAAPRVRADWALLTLLPGALCAAAVTAMHLTHGRTRLFAAAAGVLAVVLALRAALRRGPLSRTDADRPGPRPGATDGRTAPWTLWLVTYSLLGNGLLPNALSGGPDVLPDGTTDGPWPLTVAPVLALALACAPAAWTAYLFSTRARRRLAASRGLEDFAAAVRPLLLGAIALFLGALTVLLTLCATVLDEPAAYAEVLTLGALLFLARLLTTYGFTYAPAVVLTAAATAEAAALASVFASRLPGLGLLATPADTLVTTWGTGSVPTLACGAAALALLVHTTRKLTRASAHAPPESAR